jgi:hypothetical protein
MHIDTPPGEGGTPAVDPEPTAVADTPPPAPPRGASRRTRLWLGPLLALVIALVALSPFWAPDVATLLPWSSGPAVSAEDYAALAARLTAIENRPAAVPSPDVDAIKSAESVLGRRLDQLEAARNADRQSEAAVATTKAGLVQLDQRLGVVEAQSASRAANEGSEIRKMRQELARLDSSITDLAGRLPALERQVQAQAGADRADAALLVALLQMREAVEAARPFPAAYDTFMALARDRPDLVAAAEPLAEPARAGVAGRAALGKRLMELAPRIVSATEPPAEGDWGAQALARLRALVTIRRIDGAPQTGP